MDDRIVSAGNAFLGLRELGWGITLGDHWHPINSAVPPLLPFLEISDPELLARVAHGEPPFPAHIVLRDLVLRKNEYWCAKALEFCGAVLAARSDASASFLAELAVLAREPWASQQLRHAAVAWARRLAR